MECCVTRCSNKSSWEIRFEHLPGKKFYYCDFHAFDRRTGQVRWWLGMVSYAERL